MSSSSSRTWDTRWAWPRAMGAAHALGQRPVTGGEKPGGFAQVEPFGTGLAGRLLGRQHGPAAVVQLLELGPGLLEGLAQKAPLRPARGPAA